MRGTSFHCIRCLKSWWDTLDREWPTFCPHCGATDIKPKRPVSDTAKEG